MHVTHKNAKFIVTTKFKLLANIRGFIDRYLIFLTIRCKMCFILLLFIANWLLK